LIWITAENFEQVINIPKSRVFWAVGLGHFMNDTLVSMGPVILAFLSVSLLPMSNTQIGLTVTLAQFVGAISQPGFGLLADRSGGRLLGIGGVAWTATALALALLGAQTGIFWLMFIPYIAQAIGSGAFHPSGAMHAADSDTTRSASNMAYFFLLGQTGLALGPFLAGLLLDAANPHYYEAFNAPIAPVYEIPFVWSARVTPLLVTVLLSFPVLLFMTFAMPRPVKSAIGNVTHTRMSFRALPLRAFGVLGVMVALRSLAQPGSVTFIPVLFQHKGWSPSEYGAITSSFWLASGTAGVIFGNLADRFDRRAIIASSLFFAGPMFFLLPMVDGPIAFLLAMLAGGLSGGSHSIIVVLAQDMIPAAKGFASGAILGFIFAMGALGSLLIGTISDQIGLESTFHLVALVILVASVVALALPAGRQQSNTVPQVKASAPGMSD
jgi:FSR family fosmidomycin resistance protein-like MFS transporter